MHLAAVLFVVWAQSVQIPPPTGLVNDFAGVIDAATRTRIERIAEAVRSSSPGEMTVVTLSDIGDRDPAEVALRIGREWKLGEKGAPGDPNRNAGVVVLLVPKETSSTGRGRCRIEVGQGAEGFITDGTAGEICREATPLFAQRDYGAGLELAALRVAERFAREYGFTLDSALSAGVRPAYPSGDGGGDGFDPTFFIVLFVLFMVIASSSRRRGRRGRRGGLPVPVIFPFPIGRGGGGSFGGGGFGGFGGGGFGGFGGGGGFSGGGGGSSW